MRQRKDFTLISISDKTSVVEPFRTIKLTPAELASISMLDKNEAGVIETNEASEYLLLEILASREMGHLFDSQLPLERWSGFVTLNGDLLNLL
jgi:hypothetical protein